MYHDSDNPIRHDKPSQVFLCPACNKPILRKRLYKDSILYVHKEKKAQGFVEIVKACDVKKV